jgi:uncharacterized protein (TIGR04255 family)
MESPGGSEIYPNAPVALVAVEVRHPMSAPLTPVERREMKRGLAAHTPIQRSGQQVKHQISATVPPSGEPIPSHTTTEEFPQYLSRDSRLAVSMKSESLVVETTRYGAWTELREFLAAVLEVRHQVSGVDGVERVGLRYVDEIRVPDDPSGDWGEWVHQSLLGPAEVGARLGLTPQPWQGASAFSVAPQQHVVLRYGAYEGYAVDPNGVLARPISTPARFFLLDIDSFWIPSEGTPEFNAEAVLRTANDLHAPVSSLFEHLITDRLRDEVLRHDAYPLTTSAR